MIPLLVPTVLSGARGPSLDLRFLDWQGLGGLVTFTRSSSATYRDSSGTRQTAGTNVARFDHTAAGVPLGLLIEEQRTNILLNSATLATQSVSVTAQAYTLTFEGTGTVTLSGASTAGPLVGTGATNRVSLTFTPSAGTLTLTVSGTVEAANLEAGSFGTSWIPTTGAQATRSADLAAITGSNFSSFFNPADGSFVVETNRAAGVAGSPQTMLAVNDGTSNNAVTLRYRNASSNFSLFIVSGGVSQYSPVDAGTETGFGTTQRLAVGYAENNVALYANGASVSSDSTVTLPVAPSQLSLGNSLGALALNGHLRRLRFYRSRLANTQLQQLTV